MILIGIIVAVLALGGVVVYQNVFNSPVGDGSEIDIIENSENGSSQDVVVGTSEESCLTVNSPVAGSVVSFPLEITGTIDYGCWGIFEGEAGFAHIEQGGQVLVSGGQPTDRLVRMTGGYYTESEYPASFSASIPSISGGVSGPAHLVITERGDLGEDGTPYVPQVVYVPINLSQTGESMTINVYYNNISNDPNLVNCQDSFPSERVVPYTQSVGMAALNQLIIGPTPLEYANGFRTSIPSSSNINSLSISGGVAYVDVDENFFATGGSCGTASAISSLYNTLTQFSTVQSVDVRVNGTPLQEVIQTHI